MYEAGAKVKLCSYECRNQAQKGGVCWRHGANRNANDESTAFGSEFEQTTAARTLPNDRATGPPIIEQGVPGEVAILCQEIFEV